MSMMTRTEDRARLRALEASLSAIVAETLTGFDHRDCSIYDFDTQAQREADFEAAGDDAIDPALREWCQPARLKREFARADLGAKYLKENDDLADADDDSLIENAIHRAIYRTERQEWNRHDKLMVDVPRDGRRKGGTHGLPPELRRTRSAKIVNTQLVRWDATEQECEEATGFYHTVNAKIARASDYVTSVYSGAHTDVLALLLKGKSTLEIAQALGKTTRRVRQVVNGHAQRGLPGIRQFIDELLAGGIPSDFERTDPVAAVVASSVTKSKAPVGQQLDLDLVVTEVAA